MNKFHEFERMVDDALAVAGADPNFGKYRIVAANGGWELQYCTCDTNGKCHWRREYFSRRRTQVDNALQRRTNNG